MPRMIRNHNNEAAEAEAIVSEEGSEAKEMMKKGPWTAAEDAILIEYVKKHGEGNWNSVQKNSGLARCGKSCRLRWANHLRPNLKKGAFSQEEEQIIVELHAKLGNKWARMAAQLPGRTDNEIKNFWNTRMKRRQRAGLPLYPQEIQEEAAAYHFQQQQQYFRQPHSFPFSYSSLLSSSYRQTLNELSYSSATATSLRDQPDSTYIFTNPYKQFKISDENWGNRKQGLPASPVSPYRSLPSTQFNHSFAAHSAATESYEFHSESYNYGFNSSSGVTVGGPYEHSSLGHGLHAEISSNRTPQGSATPASSYTSGVDGLMGASSYANGYYEVVPLSPQKNTGLLDALVLEAQALSRTDNKSKSEDSTAAGELYYPVKSMAADQEYTEDQDTVLAESAMNHGGDTANETQKDDLSSPQLSTGKKSVAEYPLEEMNSMDDDLFSLLNNFPSEMPLPAWYRRGERQSLGLESERGASPDLTGQEFAWTLGTCWKNMPGIC